MRFFVSGTGTGVGKTHVVRAVASALRARSEPVIALKPIETGCEPDPLDALALAAACGRPDVAHDPGFYRARPPLAPFAVELAGGPALDYPRVLGATRSHLLDAPNVLIEGAGGILAPLDASRTMAELALDLGLPVLLVSIDALGTLSTTLSAVESARARGLTVAAIVLAQPQEGDRSMETNIDILRRRLKVPVHRFPWAQDPGDLVAAGAVLITRMRRDP